MANWILDAAHSQIQFKVKHLMISTVTGNFSKFEAQATASDDFSDAQISFSADVNSINTGIEQRDGHLKSADFFDAENFPTLTFSSTKLDKTNDGFKMTGDLSIRGTVKSVSLDVEFGGIMVDPWGNTKAGFTIEGKISRKEFGLSWNTVTEAGGIVVSDEVKIYGEIELQKA